jgi:hypothetical protein
MLGTDAPHSHAKSDSIMMIFHRPTTTNATATDATIPSPFTPRRFIAIAFYRGHLIASRWDDWNDTPQALAAITETARRIEDEECEGA